MDIALWLAADWEFIAKFDGDLTFEPDYFEKCFEEFYRDGKLGVGGGVICYVEGGKKRFEEAPAFHVRGATKIYRKACWDGIGGFWRLRLGHNGRSESQQPGMGTRSFPQLHLIHHRDTGSADGLWPTLVKYGRANYICGYHPLFMLSKCMVRSDSQAIHNRFHRIDVRIYLRISNQCAAGR